MKKLLSDEQRKKEIEHLKKVRDIILDLCVLEGKGGKGEYLKILNNKIEELQKGSCGKI